MKYPLSLVLVILLSKALAQDVYQVLRASGDDFAQVVPGYSMSFPDDHFPHPEFRIEWWYVTANLNDEAGRHYGMHWTLFRQSLHPDGPVEGWTSNQVWMAHASITTPEGHWFEERFARGGIGQAGVARPDGQFTAWLDDWRWTGESPAPLPATLDFSIGEFQMTLEMSADTPWVLQGDQGFSKKADTGQASYYYSQPHIEVTAELTSSTGRPVNLTGIGWMDREWSSQPLAPDQQGWDWLSLHLDDGHALMVYQIRRDDGDHDLSGSWIKPDGSSTTLGAEDIRMTALTPTTLTLADGTRKTMPLDWQIELPGLGLGWQASAIYPNQWMDTQFPYWEGPVQVSGSHSGVGFMELTGY